MIALTRRVRAVVPLLALVASVVPATAHAATADLPAAAATVEGACADGTGVTVVVDLTDLGGEVEVGCAPGTPESGAQALADAGFTATRDDAGMVCAIDGLPDPCPTTFEGSWWSYWSAGPEGEWEAYQVGPDEAAPEPGSVEGWRYFDGSAGPQVDPVTWALQSPAGTGTDTGADATTDEAPADEDTTADGGSTDGTEDDRATTDDAGVDADDEAATGAGATPLVLGAAVLVLLAVAVVVLLRRRRDGFGPPGQD